MPQWVYVCRISDAPDEGKVMEAEAGGVSLCLARVGGKLSALDNWCPHRRGPLGQGWIEGNTVVCPWHAWNFDVQTGRSEFPGDEQVAVFPIKVEGEEVLVQIGDSAGAGDGSAPDNR